MYKRLVYSICFILLPVLAANTALADLVAYYPLDEGSGTTAADASGNGHDGTIIGADVEWVASVEGYGSALNFPGLWGQYCDTGTWNPSAATGQISVAFWMKWAGDNGGYQGVVAKRDAWAEESTMWCIEIDADSLMMNWHRYGSWVDVGISPRVGEWQHIVYAFNGSTTRSYIDGNLHREASGFTFGPATDAHVLFGAVEPDNNVFNGALDEVRIYDHALSLAEIKSLSAKFGATNPNPADGAIVSETQLALGWSPGAFADSHHVYFGDNYDAVVNGTGDTDKGEQTWAVYWAAGLEIGKTYYWRIDEISTTHPDSPWPGVIWSFTIPSTKAWQPNPPDGSIYIDPNVALGWTTGFGALLHHVYLGEDFDAVNNADTSDATGIYRGPTATPTYTPPGTLPFETQYYWRVDEFDGTAMHKGDVWTFTTTPPGLGTILREVWEDIGGDTVADLTGNPNYPDNPSWSDELTVLDFWDLGLDSYGSRLRGWLYVPAVGDYTFWITSDNGSELWLSTDDDPGNVGTAPIAQVPGTNHTGHYEWDKFPEQQSAPITLDSGRYYIEVLMKEGGGGDGVVVAWEGPAIPTRAVIQGIYLKRYEALWAVGPNPGNRATGVSQTSTLSWKPGGKAAQHDVYFGTDQAAVANADTTTVGVYRGRQNLDATTYTPLEAPLEWKATYYWRIDEVNNLELASPWKGTVWSFTVADFLIVDNFEDYDDFCNRIFYKWKDGWGHSADPDCGVAASTGNGTGSTVGNLSAPYAEQTIVHGGIQSMPYEYNNTGAGGKARYSEASREFATLQNWTKNEVKALTLWFHGETANALETLYVAVEDSIGQVRVATHPDPEALQMAAWQQWNIPLTQFSGVNLASIRKMYLGVGNRNNPQLGGSGTLYFDDIRLYRPRCMPSLAKPAGDFNSNCVVDYPDLQIMTDTWLVAGAAPDDTKLTAHYQLEANFNDSSSYTGLHHGDARNGASLATDSVRGQVASFDGVDDFVDCGTFNPSAATGQLTVALWAKWNGFTAEWQGLIGKRDAWTTDDTMWCLEIERDTGDCRFFQFDSWPEHGLNLLPVGEWQHVAVSFDGAEATLYINGRSVGGSAPFSFGPKTDAAVVFGACEANGVNPFNGDLDDVRIYDYALSAAEVFYLAEPAVDLNDDGTVDLADYALLTDMWLDEVLWPEP